MRLSTLGGLERDGAERSFGDFAAFVRPDYLPPRLGTAARKFSLVAQLMAEQVTQLNVADGGLGLLHQPPTTVDWIRATKCPGSLFLPQNPHLAE